MHKSTFDSSRENVIIKKSKINKKGVFAARGFKKGEIILKWKPVILKKTDVDELKDSQKHFVHKAGKNRFFLMQAPEKFVNHSCRANTQVRNNCDVAIRNIKKGEEITSSYGTDIAFSFQCACGCKNCRGRIGCGEDDDG